MTSDFSPPTDDPSEAEHRARRGRQVFLAFMRDEFLAPLEAVVGLSEILLNDAIEKDRPRDYLADVQKMHEAARQLYLFVEDRLRASNIRPDDPDFQAALSHVRHDIGNQLNQVLGFCQILLMDERDEFFGVFVDDLEKIRGYCTACEGKLLRYREENPAAFIAGRADEEHDAAEAGLIDTTMPLPAAGRFARTPPGRILVADDAAGSREVLARLLSQDGHHVETAVDGAEALRRIETDDFDLLLIDILMPGLNGYEVLQRLKSDMRYRHIPVIVVSGLDRLDDVVRAIEIGAEDFLTKPVNQVLLKARIGACLEKRRLRERELEQIMPPDVARRYARHPDLLKEGRDAQVTVLFCDIRKFSRISDRLHPGETVAWLTDVMDELSECVFDHRGTLVDYIGDELMAMWGAPDEIPDHARLACLAAQAMQERLPRLNERWQHRLGVPVEIGIGLNSGVARVGNTGSSRRLKYGPLGGTVNLASRVQGATKYLRSNILVTGATKDLLGDALLTRRLGTVRVRNIDEPVGLYEVMRPSLPGALELKTTYEAALAEFENRRFHRATVLLGHILSSHSQDGPSLLLMSRAVRSLLDEPADFDPVWELPGK